MGQGEARRLPCRRRLEGGGCALRSCLFGVFVCNARTPDVGCRILNRMGLLQNLWDKAIECRKDVPIHPLLQRHGLTGGIGTMAEQTGRTAAADAPFRHQRDSRWSGSGWGGWPRSG